MISRICEEFGCTPSQAASELDDDPEHLAMTLLDVRQYMRCKAAYDGTVDPRNSSAELARWEQSPMLDIVKHNTYELHKRGRS